MTAFPPAPVPTGHAALVDLRARGPGSGARIRLLHYPADAARTSWAQDLPAEVQTYPDAVAMPVVRSAASAVRLTGGLYDSDGALVGHSGRGKSNRVWQGDPETLRAEAPTARAERVDGRTFFAGYHRHSFGHVLLEMVPRFWPELDYGQYDALLLYPQREGRRDSHLQLRPWAAELLGAAAGGRLPTLRIVADAPLRLAEVTVPSPGFWLKVGFNRVVRRAFDRVAGHLVGSATTARERPRMIYLSRSHLRGAFRRAGNEHAIEALMASAGVAVVHPQELSVADQVTLVRSADTVIGCDGSALHLAAFARPGTRLVALDSRPVPNQFLVDDLAELDALHVLAASDRSGNARTTSWHADLGRVAEALAVSGVTDG